MKSYFLFLENDNDEKMAFYYISFWRYYCFFIKFAFADLLHQNS